MSDAGAKPPLMHQPKERTKLTLGRGNVGGARCATIAFTTSNRGLHRSATS